MQIIEFSSSTTFVGPDHAGLAHWNTRPAAANCVLFYDPDNTGAITEKRQYVFTEWDPTAINDLCALGSAEKVFDRVEAGVLSTQCHFNAQSEQLI